MGKFSEELKQQIVQEVKKVGNITAVAKKHSIAVSTLHTWVMKASKGKRSHKASNAADRDKLRSLEKKLKETELENKILKDLLKKTNHAWLGE